MFKCHQCNELIGDKALIRKAGRDTCPKCGSVCVDEIKLKPVKQDIKIYNDGIDRGK